MKTTIRTPDGKIYTGEVVESLRVEGQKYWYLHSDGYTCSEIEEKRRYNEYHYNTLNYFKTKEEAEEKRTYDLAVGEVTRRIEELGEGGGGFEILYEHSESRFVLISNFVTCQSSATILPLMSEATAKTIIKEYKDTLLPVIFKIR